MADDYFLSRGLINENAGMLIEPVNSLNIPAFTILIPVYNVNKTISGFVCRGTNVKFHHKLVCSDNSLIYNIHRAIENTDEVCVAEGVFDCLTLTQRYNKNAIATLGANISLVTLHLLSVFKKLVFCLDNDSVGVKSAKSCVDFYLKYYPHIEIETLDYIGKDINSLEELVL